MLETTKPRTPRGPNAERRASTRAKIMDAAVRCLTEFGYAATSTPLVAKIAKVSRGSLLHQFPTKEDLIIGVAEYASRACNAVMLQHLAPYPDGPERFLRGVDAVWASLQQPEAIALMEVTVAARSDPELGARYPGFADDLNAFLHRGRMRMAQNLDVPERVEEIDVLAHLTRAALNGLAMETTFIGRSTEEALKVVALLKDMRQRLVDELKPVGARG